ncbi:Hsp70 family protein [Micromonospora sp. R77]|uniref:Hsp70 family protein n=1 Tax=Micromonospora sp. R77 TaxID=2925836 RepID=UPI001F6145FA|nr:Hsp70 family protein [Micromonospora sp. R77]MCI4066154.1 Hsp70 family protein [Micromonospora sp. R77]
MRVGQARLAIDWGSANTTAVVAWPDGTWTPLLFDGEPELPSAVLMHADGDMSTGHQAWQAAVTAPDRFVPAPRLSSEQRVTVANAEIDVSEMAAATLRRVAEQAEHTAGSRVEDARMVVPAGWGPRRRTWLRQVAHRAGLAQPQLVEAPVAVAGHLLATGVQIPVGSFLVVCDVGAGAEVSVVRRGPGGFEVLATLADPAAGGAAIDDAVAATLTAHTPPADGGGGRWVLMASLQAAKHALADRAAVTVPLPDTSATVLTVGLLEQAAYPALQRVAQLTMETLAAAEVSPQDLAGVYCVGGVARLPLLQKVLTDVVPIAPTVVADPVLAAARGAADAGADSAGEVTPPPEVPVPPVRRAAAIAVPGFASLGLVSQFLLTAEWNGSLMYRLALLNWGELAVAAVFALVASLSAGTVLASAIAARTSLTGGTSKPVSPGVQMGTGILASASLGVAVAGMYAVVGSLYIGDSVSGFLRWALLPLVPIVAAAAAMALIAARQWRVPPGGWSQLLAFPTGSVLTAGLGMALIQYSLTADRWPNLALWIDIAGRAGGLLLGVGTVMAVVSAPILRLILGVPLAIIAAALVSWPASGILGVIYAIAVAVWWLRQMWTRLLRPGIPGRPAQ